MSSSSSKRGRPAPKGPDDLDTNYAVENNTAGDVGAATAVPSANSRKKRRKDGWLPGAAPGADAACGLDRTAAAATVWGAYVASSVGRDLTALELGTTLAAEHVAPVATAPASSSSSSAIATAVPLVDVIKVALPSWKSALGKKAMGGGPRERVAGSCPILVLAQSAQRCVELLKLLAPFDVRIAKLFAKHMELEDQGKLLQSGGVVMGVGTPGRISKLIELGHLSLTAGTQLVVLDLHVDVKGYSLLNHPNITHDMFSLFREQLHPALDSGALKLALY